MKLPCLEDPFIGLLERWAIQQPLTFPNILHRVGADKVCSSPKLTLRESYIGLTRGDGWGRGFVWEEGSSQMLKLKHSCGNMGLSLTHSLQELATRTETNEQAGVSLVSFIKGGGLSEET